MNQEDGRTNKLRDRSEFWIDRPVFVTGATGLLGGRLVEELIALKAQVICLVRDRVPDSIFYLKKLHENVFVVNGDVVNRDLLERILVEYQVVTVFHLAAQTIVGVANDNPISTFNSNIMGTWNILESCRRTPTIKEIVVASSDKAYGEANSQQYTEETPLCGVHPYDVSKSCADLLCRAYYVTYGLPVCVTRCGNFFGEGDLNWNRLIPGTIRSIIRGKRPIIRSDGKYVRDYFYIGDAVYSYLLLAEKMSGNRKLWGEAFNFSNEEQMTVFELVQKILTLMGRKDTLAPIIKNEAKNEIIYQSLSAKKAKEQLGWTSLYDTDKALKTTIQWYQQFLMNEGEK